MKRRLVVLAALPLACVKPPPPEQPPTTTADASQSSGAQTESFVESGEISSIKGGITEDLMLERLESVAQRYPDSVIERLALSDLVFPRNPEESTALQGYTVVLITATTQTPAELPPSRVYVDCAGEVEDLPEIVWRSTTIETDWARVVGPFRFDGLYLLPLNRIGRADCALLMDWAKNRVGQVVTVFDIPAPPELLVLPPLEPPPEDVLRGLIAREYPFVVLQ